MLGLNTASGCVFPLYIYGTFFVLVLPLYAVRKFDQHTQIKAMMTNCQVSPWRTQVFDFHFIRRPQGVFAIVTEGAIYCLHTVTTISCKLTSPSRMSGCLLCHVWYILKHYILLYNNLSWTSKNPYHSPTHATRYRPVWPVSRAHRGRDSLGLSQLPHRVYP